MITFDETAGVLVAESGVSLDEIIICFARRGWFPPVTPGTRFVTLGGAVAADVHGKNHHVAGTIGRHILWLDVLTSAQGLVRCSPDEHDDLFNATIGGNGLTGFIVRVALRLVRIPSLHVSQTLIKAHNLTEIMDIFEEHDEHPYSVAWIDCLQSGSAMGRSIFMAGDFATPEALGDTAPYSIKKGLRLAVPCNFPSFTLNKLTLKAFNTLYYCKSPKGTTYGIIPYTTFFYPLDAVADWNRIYGRRGFIQYQFVLPIESAKEGLPEVLKNIVAIGTGSFLAVLKLFGEQPAPVGNISFPKRGYTLALDFPMGQRLLEMLDRLDTIVLDYGGRHYLTKDSRLRPETLKRSYGKALDDFLLVKERWDPQLRFRSRQSDRLQLTRQA
jgi:FAD/FMN-containing dehydrogenase